MDVIEQAFRDGFLDVLAKHASFWSYSGDADDAKTERAGAKRNYKEVTARRDHKVSGRTNAAIAAGIGGLVGGAHLKRKAKQRRQGESDEEYAKRKKRSKSLAKGLRIGGTAAIGLGALAKGKHAVRRHKELSAAKTDAERREMKVRGYFMGSWRDWFTGGIGHIPPAISRVMRDRQEAKAWQKD